MRAGAAAAAVDARVQARPATGSTWGPRAGRSRPPKSTPFGPRPARKGAPKWAFGSSRVPAGRRRGAVQARSEREKRAGRRCWEVGVLSRGT
eukprot:scaffold653_cov379-Prasinococcus_capsulatus_cf.AAC.2